MKEMTDKESMELLGWVKTIGEAKHDLTIQGFNFDAESVPDGVIILGTENVVIAGTLNVDQEFLP